MPTCAPSRQTHTRDDRDGDVNNDGGGDDGGGDDDDDVMKADDAPARLTAPFLVMMMTMMIIIPRHTLLMMMMTLHPPLFRLRRRTWSPTTSRSTSPRHLTSLRKPGAENTPSSCTAGLVSGPTPPPPPPPLLLLPALHLLVASLHDPMLSDIPALAVYPSELLSKPLIARGPFVPPFVALFAVWCPCDAPLCPVIKRGERLLVYPLLTVHPLSPCPSLLTTAAPQASASPT